MQYPTSWTSNTSVYCTQNTTETSKQMCYTTKSLLPALKYMIPLLNKAVPAIVYGDATLF